jgi:hypothetical protein
MALRIIEIIKARGNFVPLALAPVLLDGGDGNEGDIAELVDRLRRSARAIRAWPSSGTLGTSGAPAPIPRLRARPWRLRPILLACAVKASRLAGPHSPRKREAKLWLRGIIDDHFCEAS